MELASHGFRSNTVFPAESRSTPPETRAPAPAIQTGTSAQTELRPGALEPSWVIAGNPTARSLGLTESADGDFSSGLWECTEGQFKFIYYCDEIVHILEGAVTVREPGAEYTLRAGDVAHFPQGLTTYWTVHGYVKKFAIFRSKPRSLLGRIAGKLKRILQRLSGR